MKTKLLLLLFTLWSTALKAQKFQDYRSRFQYHFGGGISTSFPNLFINTHTDNLVQYDQTAPSGRLISLSYFPARRWGVNFTIEAIGRKSNTQQRATDFNTYLRRTYENRYYINTGYSLDVSNSGSENPLFGAFGRGLLGFVYRYEKDRIFIYPRLSIGLNILEFNNTQVRLKERNSNLLKTITFEGHNKAAELLSYHLSAKGGFKLTRVLWAHADVMFTYYRPNFSIKETHFNQTFDYVEEQLQHTYSNTQFGLNFQVGLTLALGKQKVI